MNTHTNETDSNGIPAGGYAFPNSPYEKNGNTFIHLGLTAKQYAAIHLRVPMSGNQWLDAMITEARRWDAAQAAMAGYADTMRGHAVVNSINDASALVENLKGGER